MRRRDYVVVSLLVLCRSILISQGITPKPAPVQTDAGVVQPLQGGPLQATSDAGNQLVVDAVLLPYEVCKHTFGSEIAKRYAVVQLTIANHDQTNSFLLQGITLDYSDWLLSGTFKSLHATGVSGGETSEGSVGAPKQSLSSSAPASAQQGSKPPSYVEQGSKSDEISSVESRIVRGQLQDRQPWTARNTVVHAAILVGTIASGFSFVTTDAHILAGISAYGNQAVPGLAAFWPDGSQAQINRVSDYGFQTNHTILRSDIVMAFFPIDNFLTPSLKQIFFKAPAGFFNPTEMLMDTKYRAVLVQMLKNAGLFPEESSTDDDARLISTAYLHYRQNPKFLTDTAFEKDRLLLGLLDAVSLNRVRVNVSGIMTTDTATIPATLSSITFAPDASGSETTANFWQQSSQVHSAKISGSFLTGGTVSLSVSVTGPDQKAVTPSPMTISVDSANSNANTIAFTYTLGATIASGTKLSFVVSKKANNGATASSSPYGYQVSYTPLPTLKVTAANWSKGTTATVNLSGGSISSATITSISGVDDKKQPISGFPSPSPSTPVTSAPYNFTFALPADIPAGSTLTFALKLVLSDGTTSSPSIAFSVPSSPPAKAPGG